ncbi:MAG: hypothetical protein IPJ65_31615 [Archangiaceae bacterium]|nr:hypothetical protein [Archangiaceae bacterium]
MAKLRSVREVGGVATAVARRVASRAKATVAARRPVAARAVDFNELRAASRVDGQAFVSAAVRDIGERVARGEKVRVVFDIDDTLADTRNRTLTLARQWDAENGTRYFERLTLEQVGHDGQITARAMGLPWDAELSFCRLWDAEFLDGKSYAHDLPIQPIIDLALQAQAAGAEVVYLTGRHDTYSALIIDQLERFGLDATPDTVVGKPRGFDTPTFKTEWLQQSAADGYYLAYFLTESRKDIAAIQASIEGVPAVLLDHAFNGPERVRVDTPVFPRAVF